MKDHKETTSDDDVIINETNFTDYFFAVNNHKPQRGQVIARYAAVAMFVDGELKRNIVSLLAGEDFGGQASVQILRKMAGATDKSSRHLAIEMCEDLLAGMSIDEVCQKEYKYDVEFFWYTERKYIPADDPHWSCLQIQNLDSFLEHEEKCNGFTIKSKIVLPEQFKDDKTENE
jgi:hypothetical protein